MRIAQVLLFVFVSLFSALAFGQSHPDVEPVLKQGIDLMNSKKFTEAIVKFNEVLKLDPDNQKGNYELAYSLFASGHGKEAIPYLEKLVQRHHSAGGVFDMLGSIYDDNKEPEKAIACYLQGIKADSAYQRLYFNVAVTYYRQGQYIESEKYAIKAIKLDTKHVSSQQVYAAAAEGLKKRGCALLAWCSLLLMEPQTQRSTAALAHIKAILNYGGKKNGGKSAGDLASTDSPANLAMANAVRAATSGKTKLLPVDSLQLQLTSVFKTARTAMGETEVPFVLTYFADYFEKLANTNNMPAFTRLISINAYKENYQWLKDNDKQLKALDSWMAATKRAF
jgi:Tfp pilus assembly protein PilF